jgi:hypothetical protein
MSGMHDIEFDGSVFGVGIPSQWEGPGGTPTMALTWQSGSFEGLKGSIANAITSETSSCTIATLRSLLIALEVALSIISQYMAAYRLGLPYLHVGQPNLDLPFVFRLRIMPEIGSSARDSLVTCWQ